MQIVDLKPEYEKKYFVCMDTWYEDISEVVRYKENWYSAMKDKGLIVKLALVNGVVCGMIQLVPSDLAFAEGSNFYFIHCIWVHGHRQGIGNYQKQGIGKALLQAAEQAARDGGSDGIAAWGLGIPVWMKASWYIKQGYEKIDKNGQMVLVWKPFRDGVTPPKWIKQKKTPEKGDGVVKITAFRNGWCPVQNIIFERTRKAAEEFSDFVKFEEIDTLDRKKFLEWGIADGLYIEGKPIATGAPLSEEKIKKKITRYIKKKRKTKS